MKNNQQFGIGLESEGFLVDSQGRGVEIIEDIPAAEWVLLQAEKKRPQIRGNLSLEQASVMLEVKSDLFAEEEQAIAQIQAIRDEINQLLAGQAQLKFLPVLPFPFRFIPATRDPDSRTNQLIRQWSQFGDVEERLMDTATASFQVNDSRIFRGCPEELRLDMGRRIMNSITSTTDLLVRKNCQTRDFSGLTRLDRAIRLLTKVKREQFESRGFSAPEIVIPPLFASIDEFKKWICAHSNVDRFELAECKNEHAVTAKLKRKPFWAIETRIFDAVDSPEEMLRLSKINRFLLDQAV